MQERSRREKESVERVKRVYGPPLGLNAVNGGGTTSQKLNPRLGLRISRRWQQVAPILRLSLQDVSTLPTIQAAHCEWLTGLLRAGLDMRQIARLRLDDMRLTKQNREGLLVSLLKEKAEK